MAGTMIGGTTSGPALGKSDSAVGVTDSLALRDLYAILKKEAETPMLLSIPLDAYQKVAIELGNLKGQGYEGVEAKIRDQMAELVLSSARLLLLIRYSKLKKSKDSGETIDYSKLTDEEKYILDGEKECERRINAVVAATVSGRPKVLESISAKIRTRRLVVRFVKPVEQFVGVDLSKYGPFQQEDVAVLPFENARSLVQGGDAVEIHAQL